MVGWHHRLTQDTGLSKPGDGEGQGGLPGACGVELQRREDTTEEHDNNKQCRLGVCMCVLVLGQEKFRVFE